jgi:hypothetical protein
VINTYQPSGWRKLSITWFEGINSTVVESELPPDDGFEYLEVTPIGGKTTWMRGKLKG